MARVKYSVEHIIHKLREAKVLLGQGQTVKDICQKWNITADDVKQELHRRALSIWRDIVNVKPNKAPSTHRADNLIPESPMDDKQVNGLFSIKFSLC